MNIIFDVGGTTTRIARVLKKGKFEKPEIFPTPMKYKDFLHLFNKHKTGRVIGCIAGGVDRHGKLVRSTNIPQFVGKNIVQDLSKLLKADVAIYNDAVCGGYGEIRFGAGKKSEICAYITVGTGVGGARFINGEVDKYRLSFEPGKQFIYAKEDSLMTLEELVSGKALQEKYEKIPSDISGMEVWKEVENILAVGLANVTALWTPDTIVLGGSIILKTKLSISRLSGQVRKIVNPVRNPKIFKATLGDSSGLYGALAFLNTK